MARKIDNAETQKFKDKYGDNSYFTLLSLLKGKPVPEENECHITIEDRSLWVEEINTKFMRGKAYLYVEGFTKEVVVDFLELDEEDKLGFKEYKIIGFKQYNVVY